jgi:type II secretory pathway component PulM
MNPRERTLALIVGSLVAIMVLWKLVASPVAAKAGELRERAAAASAAIDAEQALWERADAIKARDARLFVAKELTDVGTVEAAFLEFVNKSAEDSGVKVASERPSNSVRLATKTRGPYAEIQVALTGEGTLEALVKFLGKLAAGERPLRVVAASVSRTDRTGVLAVNVRLSTVAVREGVK